MLGIMADTKNSTACATNRTYEIRPKNLNCRSKNIVYLISCKTCRKQYTGNLGQGLIIIGVRIVAMVKT